MGVFSGPDRFVFIHIPKNGGNAIAMWAQGKAKKPIVVMEHRNDLLGIMDKHSNATQWRSWFKATGRAWDNILSFATIRDPLTRPQSVMTEIRRNRPWAQVAAGDDWWNEFSKLESVDDFILSGLYDPDGPLHITHTQHWFVSDPNGEVIVKRLVRMDVLSKVVPKMLGLPGPVPVVHKGQYQPCTLSNESQLEVRRLYYDDFALYGEMNGQ